MLGMILLMLFLAVETMVEVMVVIFLLEVKQTNPTLMMPAR